VYGPVATTAVEERVDLPDEVDGPAGPTPVTMIGADAALPVPTPARRATDRPRADTTAVLDARREETDPLDDLEAYIERRLEEAPFVFLPNRGRAYAVAKRTVDIVGAVCLLVVALPVMLVLATIIRLDSPGPALFRQTRVTRGGRTFRFYKFRTMYVDARERFPELYAYTFTDSQFDDAFYKLADDPRNTRVGRWLRRTTLDELPNLFNVLRGDLSLVGPRPELPELVLHYRPGELACFFTKAGLTGLAQVAGRSLLTVRERLTLDVRYVAHQTLVLDLRILWRTVLVVVAGRGAF
jgi:lipopolysaccharide/colanic/teichoic acid biosynthesis glycosyltransferase